jgi:hypothetical protein
VIIVDGREDLRSVGRSNSRRRWLLLLGGVIASACGSPTAPTQTPPDLGIAFSASGSVVSRITGAPVEDGTITFTGIVARSARVSAGRYTIPDMVTGIFDVTIEGPGFVPHETQDVGMSPAGQSPSFSVLTYGTSPFGIPTDDLFYRFFHQVARVSGSTEWLRKWRLPPNELYVVPNDEVPQTQFDEVVSILGELAVDSVPDLWCRLTESVAVTVGPCDGDCGRDGRIVVRPRLSGGSTGTLGPAFNGARGEVTLGASTSQGMLTRERLRSTLLHEIYHVAFGFHLCGGDVGLNPFGFSLANCPFPDSAMANRAEVRLVLSPQDKAAACIVYHPDTVVGNTWQDVNPRLPSTLGLGLGIGQIVR